MNKETLGDIFSFAIVALIGLHAWVGFSSKRELTGFLKEIPSAGYVWDDSQSQENKNIFSFGKISWLSGQIHPDGFHVVSSDKEGFWYAMPGYKLQSTKGLETLWEPMQPHPTQHARASEIEGQWVADLGYEFEQRSDEKYYTIWKPNMTYENLHITTSSKEGYFSANPGYQFTNPENGLDVKWVEGLENPYNTQMLSGYTEGTWVEKGYDAGEPDAYTYEDNSIEQEKEHYTNAILFKGAEVVTNWLTGNKDNWFSSSMRKVSNEELGNGLLKTSQRVFN